MLALIIAEALCGTVADSYEGALFVDRPRPSWPTAEPEDLIRLCRLIGRADPKPLADGAGHTLISLALPGLRLPSPSGLRNTKGSSWTAPPLTAPRSEREEHWRQANRDFGFQRNRAGRVKERLDERLEARRQRP